MKSLSYNEIVSFLNSSSKKEPYKMKGHSFTPLKNTGKQYCKGCGLVAGNNDFSIWCVDKGCNYMDHPQYAKTRKKLTKFERNL